MKLLNFRIAKDDLKVIQDGAKSVNKTLSDYARDNLLSRAKVEAETRDKEANVFIKEIQEIKTNIKILSSKLSEIDGKIATTNDRITTLENRNTAFENRLFTGINDTLMKYLVKQFKTIRDYLKMPKEGI